MTDRDDKRRPDGAPIDEAELEALAARGFVERGELLPTTETDVERAEQNLADSDVVLPAKLERTLDGAWAGERKTRKRAAATAHPTLDATRRRPWLGYAASGAIGALAASVTFLWIGRGPVADGPPIGASNEFVARKSAPASSNKLHLEAPTTCQNDCCAGSACPNARDDLKACVSGRRCVGCSGAHVDGAYRVRVGNLALSDDGKRLRDEGEWTDALELCVRAGNAELNCAPTQPQGTTVAPWTMLPNAVTPQNLLAGFELSVREHGKPDPIATWSTPVVVNADVLCRGIAAKPSLQSGANFAVVSVFLEDAYYVELGRSAVVGALTSARTHFDVVALTPALRETTAPGERRFVLALGPIDQQRAEEVRWQVLGAGNDAKVSVGSDYVGESKALP